MCSKGPAAWWVHNGHIKVGCTEICHFLLHVGLCVLHLLTPPPLCHRPQCGLDEGILSKTASVTLNKMGTEEYGFHVVQAGLELATNDLSPSFL